MRRFAIQLARCVCQLYGIGYQCLEEGSVVCALVSVSECGGDELELVNSSINDTVTIQT